MSTLDEPVRISEYGTDKLTPNLSESDHEFH